MLRIRRSIIAALSLAVFASASAIPAKPGLLRYANGTDSISVYLHGDEHAHYFTTSDGYVLKRGNDERFRYAVANGTTLVASDIIASDPKRRSAIETSFLQNIDTESNLTLLRRQHTTLPRRSAAARVAPEAGECQFPVFGSPHCMIILVEFADNSFTVENPQQTFHNMLNQKDFSKDGATGSALDYFKASSNNQFTPQFDVFGPVKLSRNMSYYGANDYNGQDVRPQDMVIEACDSLDKAGVDFSIYDTNNDGEIDNVYVFYAGYGEADGGKTNTIWPHAWDIFTALGQRHTYDGKLLNHYATSNELSYGSGSSLNGIGPFCHEFSHVLGLPDLYATSYTAQFTPGEWSLMDQGSYNNRSHTPPTFSAYERYCMGWLEPKELNEPCPVSMYPISTEGKYGDAYLIRTERENEYFILENRQKTSWDSYIPGHGMLVWHIDYDPSIWARNVVNNASKQHIDIVEADNTQNESSRAGDAFPGTAKVTSYTDDTTPSMRMWNGSPMHSPITEISEDLDGVISFLFRGGEDIFGQIEATEATDITPAAFTANWKPADGATSYLLSVYSITPAGNKTFVNGMNRANVGQITGYRVNGLNPSTTYYYEIQAIGGYHYSKMSNTVTVTTKGPTLDYYTAAALPATGVAHDSFTANWEMLEDADYYTVTLQTMQSINPNKTVIGFDNNRLPSGWSQAGCSYDGRSTYSVTAPALKFNSDGSSVTSAEFADGITGVSFWYRSSLKSDDNAISVEAFAAGAWSEIIRVNPLANALGGARVSIDELPDGCTRLRFSLSAPITGAATIDDITISHGLSLEMLPIAEYTDINVGNVTSYEFSGLKADTEYAYSVKAHHIDQTSGTTYSSKESNVVTVKTLGGSGIGEITYDNNDALPAIYFNLQGIQVKEPKSGEIYIRRQGSKVSKVLFR